MIDEYWPRVCRPRRWFETPGRHLQRTACSSAIRPLPHGRVRREQPKCQVGDSPFHHEHHARSAFTHCSGEIDHWPSAVSPAQARGTTKRSPSPCFGRQVAGHVGLFGKPVNQFSSDGARRSLGTASEVHGQDDDVLALPASNLDKSRKLARIGNPNASDSIPHLSEGLHRKCTPQRDVVSL